MDSLQTTLSTFCSFDGLSFGAGFVMIGLKLLKLWLFPCHFGRFFLTTTLPTALDSSLSLSALREA
jgi:hypothetical protein